MDGNVAHVRFAPPAPQLALALLLAARLQPGLTARPLAFDPCFEATDKAVLEELGVEVRPQGPGPRVPFSDGPCSVLW